MRTLHCLNTLILKSTINNNVPWRDEVASKCLMFQCHNATEPPEKGCLSFLFHQWHHSCHSYVRPLCPCEKMCASQSFRRQYQPPAPLYVAWVYYPSSHCASIPRQPTGSLRTPVIHPGLSPLNFSLHLRICQFPTPCSRILPPHPLYSTFYHRQISCTLDLLLNIPVPFLLWKKPGCPLMPMALVWPASTCLAPVFCTPFF